MGSTSNYSWPTPEQTDLVKDGWDAIKDLGDAADTTVKAVADGRGCVHINETDIGTGVSAVSIGSDADPLFSSEFQIYFFTIINGAGSTAGVNLLARLRANVTDASGSNYVQNEIYNTASTALAASTTTTAFKIGYCGNVGSVTEGYIFNPFEASRTFLLSSSFSDSTTPLLIQGRLGGEHNLTTSYNGITIFPSAGTLTGGKIRFYGVKN